MTELIFSCPFGITGGEAAEPHLHCRFACPEQMKISDEANACAGKA